MDQADDLRAAMAAAEKAFGGAIERYRRAIGCCARCGDFFEIGELALVMADDAGRIQFEHRSCPDDAVNVRDRF